MRLDGEAHARGIQPASVIPVNEPESRIFTCHVEPRGDILLPFLQPSVFSLCLKKELKYKKIRVYLSTYFENDG
jgi:hypothetical protein